MHPMLLVKEFFSDTFDLIHSGVLKRFQKFIPGIRGIVMEKNLDSVESLLRAAVMDAYYGRSPLDVLSRPERLAGIKYDEFNARIASYFSKPGGVEMVVLPEEKNECKK